MDTNKLSDISRENIPFYIEKNENKAYSISPMKVISESEILIPFSLFGDQNYNLTIKNFKNGIFQIFLDLTDKSIKYTNKVEIGKNLTPVKFNSIISEENKLTLINKDDDSNEEINIYKLIIDLKEFSINYFINDII